MATIRILLGIICLVVGGGTVVPDRHFLGTETEFTFSPSRSAEIVIVEGKEARLASLTTTIPKAQQLVIKPRFSDRLGPFYQYPDSLTVLARAKVLAVATSQVGVREATGKNDGKEVVAYLAYTGNRQGEPWCASFVSWVFGKAGFTQPRTAWSPALFPKEKLSVQPLPAQVFGIYFANYKRIAHCGLVEFTRANWVYTIEGNTNSLGSRDGDGVYRKIRHCNTIQYFANWLAPVKKGGQP